MTRRRAAAVILTGLLGTTAGSADTFQRPRSAVVIRLEPYVGRLVTVAAAVDGQPVRMLLDTGAGQTLITPQTASRIGCTPAGRRVGFRMSGERVEFSECPIRNIAVGGRSLPRDTVAVWDVMAALPAGLPPIDGVLGLDLFVDQPITLDLSGRSLVLETDQTLKQRIKGMTPVRARVATGVSGADVCVFLRGSMNRVVWFLMDSANLDTIVAAAHLSPANHPLTIDALPPSDEPVTARELIHDGALSERYLRRFVWTLDLRQPRVWASPASQ